MITPTTLEKSVGDDARLRPLLHHHVLEEISRLSRTEAGE